MAAPGRTPMPVRERRSWSKRLMEAQEAVEAAESARNKLMHEAYEAGVSYANIELATGIGALTTRKLISDAGGTQQDR